MKRAEDDEKAEIEKAIHDPRVQGATIGGVRGAAVGAAIGAGPGAAVGGPTGAAQGVVGGEVLKEILTNDDLSALRKPIPDEVQDYYERNLDEPD